MRPQMQAARDNERLEVFQAAVLTAFLQGAFKKGTTYADALKSTGLSPDTMGQADRPKGRDKTADEAMARAREILDMARKGAADA